MSESTVKPRVAIFDFSSCEGCELQIANIEEEIVDLVNIVDIVSFREVMKEHSEDYDIAIIEGSIIRPIDTKRIKEIRKKAKVLVALGACACLGGVNRLRNKWSNKEALEGVYGDPGFEFKKNPYFDIHAAKAVDEVVKVDYYIPGCPMNNNEFKKIVAAIAIGKKVELPHYPVCVECKKNENVCVFEKGQFCLGPITMAGCDAWCPNYGNACEGCRGLLKEPDTSCAKEIFERYGVTYEQMMERRDMFNYGREAMK